MKSPYETLGVKQDALPANIPRTYRCIDNELHANLNYGNTKFGELLKDEPRANELPHEEPTMANSKHLAGLIGPSLVALGITEAININVFANPTAPVVYLNGAILFVAGLAIVRAHSLWTWRWSVAITLIGWVTLFGGLWRMAVPDAPQAAASGVTYVVLAAIVATGALLSFKAYGWRPPSAQKLFDD